tara:strand:- start:237 stop:473 length:237 start_codon:yes stop_codon:yes gene_type:complete
MSNLFNRLKPEMLDAFNRHLDKSPPATTDLIGRVESLNFITELTIGDAVTLTGIFEDSTLNKDLHNPTFISKLFYAFK